MMMVNLCSFTRKLKKANVLLITLQGVSKKTEQI